MSEMPCTSSDQSAGPSETENSERAPPLEVIVRHNQQNNQIDALDADSDVFFDATDVQDLDFAEADWLMLESDDWAEFEKVLNENGGMLMERNSHYSYRLRIGDSRNGNQIRLQEDDDNGLEVDLEDEDISTFCLPGLDTAKEHAEIIVKKFWAASHKVTHFYSLPEWLQDNDFLHTGHRPPMPSFGACFKSVFALHTETGNIWSHALGCVAFVGVAAWFLTRPVWQVQWQEKVVFGFFFACAIACLGLSSAFHTFNSHSRGVAKLFSKLDYVGISLMLVGSFVPWLFYAFYCRPNSQIVYIALIVILGVGSIVVSLWDKFGTPRFRPLRAGLFVGMGLSGVVPAVHFMITDGFLTMFDQVAFHWLLLMAFMYVGGAALYAARIPERFFPGKCDIWFQSHQIFHLLVIGAAFVHYHGMSEMAGNRLASGSCREQLMRYM